MPLTVLSFDVPGGVAIVTARLSLPPTEGNGRQEPSKARRRGPNGDAIPAGSATPLEMTKPRSGEVGFYFLQRYDLRRWACHYASLQLRHERWFARQGARFVDLAVGPRSGLAARVLEAATDRPFPDVVTGDDNTSSARIGAADAILTYGLRVMNHYATGEAVNVPSSLGAARRALGKTAIDEAAFVRLSEEFQAGVTREVQAGVEDFRRLGPLAREWRVWFSSDAVGWKLGG